MLHVRGGRGALVECLTASLVIHASRVRAPLILCEVFEEISVFFRSQCDNVTRRSG